MKNALFSLFFLLSFATFCQEQRIIVYDLLEETVDTIMPAAFDTTIIEEHTPFYIGDYDNQINMLCEDPPSEFIYEGTNWTKKRQASQHYDINKYPIRTSVRLCKWENDSIKAKCPEV